MALPTGPEYRPPTEPLDIIYRDDSVLLVNKPSGLLAVAGKTDDLEDCLEARVKRAFRQALLIHRLDMDTSGIMVFAMSRPAQRHLNMQFEKRLVGKTYIARIWGHPDTDAGRIDLPLTSDWPRRPLQKVCHDTGKPAQTDWQVLDRDTISTRVILRPSTGRTHQLRVHMLALGHPILGDRFYATGQALAASPRLNLHAQSLEFQHPESGEQVSFTADCPF